MDCFKPVTLEDQALLTKIFAAVQPTSSEYTFPYLFIWKQDYNLSYAVIANHLCMISQSRVFPPYAFCPMPADGKRDDEGFKQALTEIEAYFDKKGLPLMFGRVEEKRLDELRLVYGSRMEAEYLASVSDYVYEAPKLIDLSGKKLSGKRNHIHQFLRQYADDYEYVPVDESGLSECKHILDAWCDKNEGESVHPDNSERVACYELFNNWGRLGVKGALLKVAGRFEAFTVGELLNRETAAIRIEKANSSINGIYTVINREFCAHEWNHVKYVNREEDMGIKGLRKSKQSYNPVSRVNKYLVKILK